MVKKFLNFRNDLMFDQVPKLLKKHVRPSGLGALSPLIKNATTRISSGEISLHRSAFIVEETRGWMLPSNSTRLGGVEDLNRS